MALFDINRQLNAFRSISFKPMACRYCWSSVLSPTGKYSFCQFCGAYTEGGADPEKPEDISFHNTMLKIHSSISEGSVDTAKSLSSTLFTRLSDPEKLFCGGALYLFFSDNAYSNKDYALTGFMEKNSANVYESLDLISKSKEFFYKTAWLIDSTHSEERDEKSEFIAFLSFMYLKQHKRAKQHLDVLNTVSKTALQRYADMIYSVELGTKDAAAKIETLLRENEINSFFYLGKYLAKQRKLTEAEALLSAITSICKHPQAEELLNKIRNTEQALSLQ